MKDFFPESLGQERGCALYTAKCGVLIKHLLQSEHRDSSLVTVVVIMSICT